MAVLWMDYVTNLPYILYTYERIGQYGGLMAAWRVAATNPFMTLLMTMTKDY